LVTKRKKHKAFIKSRGQALVEFALVLPLLLLLLIGAIEFGRLFFIKIALTNAAREGAYYLSLYPDDTVNAEAAIKTELLNSGVPLNAEGNPDIIITYPNCSTPGNCIRVNVETAMPDLFITGFFSRIFSLNKLSAFVEMMVQPQP
jgi:Flp pilus assembly protein TadG